MAYHNINLLHMYLFACFQDDPCTNIIPAIDFSLTIVRIYDSSGQNVLAVMDDTSSVITYEHASKYCMHMTLYSVYITMVN